MTQSVDINSNELFGQFEWYSESFNSTIQEGSDDFLYAGLRLKLYSVGKNINTMSPDESYFVTKVKIDPQNEVYIRCSDGAVNAILTRSLGPSKKFDINKITELEAQLVTAFNDNLYNYMSEIFEPYGSQSRKFDMTHLTFFVQDVETKLNGKIILTFPSQIVNPQTISSNEEKFSNNFFMDSSINVNITIGTTSFSVGDLKALETEDIVVLDNSNIQTLTLSYNEYIKDFRITPNPALIISVDNNGGEDMAANTPASNLWDSIQVEMVAEFDKIKISLGDLKNIEQGLVVDVGSIYDNKVILRVEEKIIASGELVIVNDKYGVKINEIYAETNQPAVSEQPQMSEQNVPNNDYNAEQMPEQYAGQPDEMIGEPVGESIGEHYGEAVPQEGIPEGDFDYSDFELDDEDL